MQASVTTLAAEAAGRRRPSWAELAVQVLEDVRLNGDGCVSSAPI